MAPSPITAQAREPGFHPVVHVLSWMLLSNAMIMFNKYLLDTVQFPITLTFLHLTTTTVFTQLLARYTPLIARPSSPITGRLCLRTILPIGLLYTLSLICSNMSYTTLPLPNIQMLKALAPLFTLIISWIVSLTNPKVSTLGNMVVISLGAYASTLGELSLVGRGLWVCMLGTAAECGRLLIIEKLLKEPRRGRFPGAGSPVVVDEEDGEGATVTPAGGMGMSPLVALYYFAPVCMVLSGSLALAFEMRTLSMVEVRRVGSWTLALSGTLAFLLNVAGVFLISKTSALAVSLLGLLKSPIPILASLLVWNTPVTFTQIMGYGLSLAGMFFYGLSPEGMGPQVDAWFGTTPDDSFSEPGIRDATEPIVAKATAYLGSLISIESKDGDEEAQRGRAGRRDGTPRPSPEKATTSSDSVASKGEPPIGAPIGKVGGRLD